MTTIKLTRNQLDSLFLPVLRKRTEQVQESYDKMALKSAKMHAAKLRRADAKVATAKTRTAQWKQRYSETRKQLLEARAEVFELKRELRTGSPQAYQPTRASTSQHNLESWPPARA